MSPAVSKKQRQAMAIAEQVKKGNMKAKPGTPSAEMAKSMTKPQLHDFRGHQGKGFAGAKDRHQQDHQEEVLAMGILKTISNVLDVARRSARRPER